MKILGIDPGTATTGYGLISVTSRQRYRLVDFGWVKTSKEDGPGQRLAQIYRQVGQVLKRERPDVVATEKIFFATNAKTAISVGQSMGVISLAVAQAKLPQFEYAPMQIKLVVTGSGRADKQLVKKTVRSLLKFRSPRKRKTHFDDVCDALAVAICHARMVNSKSKRR